MRVPLILCALRDLVETIDLFTDCMDNRIDREPLDPYIERAEQILEGVSVNSLHPTGLSLSLPSERPRAVFVENLVIYSTRQKYS